MPPRAKIEFAPSRYTYATARSRIDIDFEIVHRLLSGTYWSERMRREEAHPRVQTLKRWCLATRDAHGLYRQPGFVPRAG